MGFRLVDIVILNDLNKTCEWR